MAASVAAVCCNYGRSLRPLTTINPAAFGIAFSSHASHCCTRRVTSVHMNSVAPAERHAAQLQSEAVLQERAALLDLRLHALSEQAGRVRIRQHANPLSERLMAPVSTPDWPHVFDDPQLPVALDIGCAGGRFLLTLSARLPGHNFFGLDIRPPLIDRGNLWAQQLGTSGNVHFLTANATAHLQTVLAGYPGSIDLITIQFPDPHYKRKHRKRRVVQLELVRQVAAHLAPGGRLFLQSDVEDVAIDMRNQFEQHADHAFRPAPLHDQGPVFFSAPRELPDNTASGGAEGWLHRGPATAGGSFGAASRTTESQHPVADHTAAVQHSSDEPADELQEGDEGHGAHRQPFTSAWAEKGWLQENPLGVPTERELSCLKRGLQVYRVMLTRV